MKSIMKTLFSMLLTLAFLNTLVFCAWATVLIVVAIAFPSELSIYLNNLAYFLCGTISLIFAVAFWIALFIGKRNYWFI